VPHDHNSHRFDGYDRHHSHDGAVARRRSRAIQLSEESAAASSQQAAGSEETTGHEIPDSLPQRGHEGRALGEVARRAGGGPRRSPRGGRPKGGEAVQ